MSRNSDLRAIDNFVIQGLLKFFFRLIVLFFWSSKVASQQGQTTENTESFASIIIRIIYQKTGALANPDPLKGFRSRVFS